MDPRALLLTLLLTLLLALPASAADHPNIVFFLADDMGMGDIGAYDASSKIPTPSMDRIAAEGARFRDVHAPTASCTATRYAVLTGRHAFRSRLEGGVLRSAYDPPLLETRHETVADLMRRAGYRTAAFGKWHLGMAWTNRAGDGPAIPGVGTSPFSTTDVDFTKPILDGPRQHGFDRFFGIGSSINHGPYTFIADDRVTVPPTRFRRPAPGAPSFREGWIALGWDDSQQGTVVSDRALAFLRTQVATEPGRPFFVYYAATANHWPHVPPERLYGRQVRGAGGRDNAAPRRNDMVVENDAILGALLDFLDDPNGDGDTGDSIAASTLLIVTSDNGADVGLYAPIRGGKGNIEEGGHRVPFLARWPGRILPGTVSDAVFSLMDLYATLAALTGTPARPGDAEDSRNALPGLLGTADAGWSRGPLLVQATGGSDVFAVRDGRWKLVMRAGKASELYDLADDPRETHDLLARKPAVAQRLARTFAAMTRRSE